MDPDCAATAAEDLVASPLGRIATVGARLICDALTCPNGDATRSSAAVAAQSGSIKLNAKVYEHKSKSLKRPLILIAARLGLTAKSQTGETLAYSPKDSNTRLWSMPPLIATTSTSTDSNSKLQVNAHNSQQATRRLN